jgi:hypothetical protein
MHAKLGLALSRKFIILSRSLPCLRSLRPAVAFPPHGGASTEVRSLQLGKVLQILDNGRHKRLQHLVHEDLVRGGEGGEAGPP